MHQYPHKYKQQYNLIQSNMNFSDKFGDKLLTKSGEKSAAEVLSSKKFIGIYFSAHWCPPCRGFTPVLAEFYEAAKEHGVEIEIVFVSSDPDPGSFNEYYATMPWTAQLFEERDKKGALANEFGVSGIPMLVILNSEGTVLDVDGRATVAACKGDVNKAIATWTR